MRAICFIQETKDSDLTQRQQQLICHRALRKLLWPLRVGTVRPGRHRGTADLAAARHGGSDARRRGRRGGCADRHRHPAPALQPRRNWTGCSCRCCNTVSTPLARTTASGSSRADGTGWRCRGMTGSCTNEYRERSFASPAGLGVCARRQRQPCAA